MDAGRFDEIARGLDARRTRRGLAGVALGALAALGLGAGVGVAAKKGKKGKKKKKKQGGCPAGAACGVACCGAGTVCQGNLFCVSCGGPALPCCPGGTCDAGLACIFNGSVCGPP